MTTANEYDNWYSLTNEQLQPNDFRTEEFTANIRSVGIVDITTQGGDIKSVVEVQFDDNGPAINFFPPQSLNPQDIKGYSDIARFFRVFKDKGVDVKIKPDFTQMICIPDITGSRVKMIPRVTEKINENVPEGERGHIKKYTNWDIELIELKTSTPTAQANGAAPATAGGAKIGSVTIDQVKDMLLEYIMSENNPDGSAKVFKNVDIIKHIKTTVAPADQPAYNMMRGDALKQLETDGLIEVPGSGQYRAIV